MTHSDRNITHQSSPSSRPEQQITLRGPAELADALPYLLGYHPDDSIVVVAVHGDRGRFGGRIRLGIPSVPEEWPGTARQVADCLLAGSEARGPRPSGAVLYVCQDPSEEEEPAAVMARLRPLVQELRTACGALDMPVYEALCISGGRFWSYCCPDARCCPPEGVVLAPSGSSAMAAAAAYAGIQVRGSLKELAARFTPPDAEPAGVQERALDAAAAALLPRMLDGSAQEGVRVETLELAACVLDRFSISAGPARLTAAEADTRDDGRICPQEAASLVVGLQDRVTRDRAAEWMEGADAEAALRLWRVLSRRCVGAYAEYAAAPLTLAGWVAWSLGDETNARVALGAALEADPECVFARLLHSACNNGLDPEPLRATLRGQRSARGGVREGGG
ncbi:MULTISPECIES: DUF4192 domain-containing protein [unclassified Streptomyces]|uniref:DUF4192 domain-containing protein n=1 Tax=unclassified Streptomyces TaxID=2593676 RepID=UPI0022B68327|nr:MULTISPECIES: DUF4192 domain-containing protein [unclassified Streptomyces]MCZ7416110.1 DUF4192 domain-containing protein [Streptomyces sp. WMMC897]MCZ7434082.1 DUF4192 domain-containing protein [Streptomyces sp. WMMC1477]